MNQTLRAGREALQTLWREGLSGQALLEKHTAMMDTALVGYFDKCRADTDQMALIALGGYGRRELFPYSDIDLMLLYRSDAEEELDTAAQAIFYPLWDAGIEVGHGVRTIDTCLEKAGQDFFLQVSLLDARLLAGSEPLFAELMERFQGSFVEGRRKSFLRDMLFHRAKRHERFGNHSFLLEPHIKESRGGFRDIQAMLWTSQVVFSLRTARDLEIAGLLTTGELAAFDKACDDLVKIRNRLHFISGRKNDQLYFEHQEEMASAFGYRDENGVLGVESFMRDVHENLQNIAITTDLFFEHANEVLGPEKPGKRSKTLEQGITLRQNRIHLSEAALKNRRPNLLMRAFSHVARTGCPLHHRSKKLISKHLHLVDDKLRRSKLWGRAFLDTLQSREAPLAALTGMLETGLLSAYIPEFKQLKSLAQHDIYHVYTVDRHLLQTVEELNQLRNSEHTLFITVTSPQILFLAGLLHDIGKGHGKNHAEYGAELAKDIGERLGLAEGEVQCLVFLVREHLYLPEVALRRDLEDEALIVRCARHIKDPDRLTMLYLLAIADARATGPAAWSDWKAALLLELYLKIINLLGRSDLSVPDPLQEVTWMREQVAAQLDQNPPIPLKTLPDDYLLSFTPEEIARHIRYERELKKEEVLLVPTKESGHWSLLVMAQDRPGILSKICGVLALHNLKVLAAQIYTWDNGTIVDVLDVASTVDNTFEEQDWEKLESDLGKAIHFRLGLTHRLHRKLHPLGFAPPQLGQRPPAKVVFDTQASDAYTVIEVYAENRPGLLYDITRTLSDFGINTFRAKLGTKGDQVVDAFYVLDHDGNKIEETPFQREIRDGLLHAAA